MGIEGQFLDTQLEHGANWRLPAMDAVKPISPTSAVPMPRKGPGVHARQTLARTG